MKSIIQKERVCYFCGNHGDHLHHIFYGANRKISDKYGCVVWLCWFHHEHPQCGVHWTDPNNHEVGKANDQKLKRVCQAEWEKRFGTREDFIRIFGRSWYDE